LGDSRHGDLKQNRGMVEHFSCPGLMLHASHMQLPHPVTGEVLSLTAKWDPRWQHLVQQFGWVGRVTELERVAFAAQSGEQQSD